jgi:hypothetical protein
LSPHPRVYDDTKDTTQAISLGIARTGKLVTSAALVLVFAFFSLSTGPAGHQAVRDRPGRRCADRRHLIRALLVPSLMMLLGSTTGGSRAGAPRTVRASAQACGRDGLARNRLGDRINPVTEPIPAAFSRSLHCGKWP